MTSLSEWTSPSILDVNAPWAFHPLPPAPDQYHELREEDDGTLFNEKAHVGTLCDVSIVRQSQTSLACLVSVSYCPGLVGRRRPLI